VSMARRNSSNTSLIGGRLTFRPAFRHRTCTLHAADRAPAIRVLSSPRSPSLLPPDRSRDGDVDADSLPGSLCDERIDLIEAAPVLTDDEQSAALRSAEGV